MSALSKSYEDRDFKGGANDNNIEAVSAKSAVSDSFRHRSVSSVLKRGLDIAVAGTALLFTLPILVLVGLAIWLQDGEKSIFVQKRVGLNGEKFNCLKFRTMVADAEARLNEVLERDAEARHEWETMRKLTIDPRITGLGRFLRKSSLDELPQLINVLRGDMSLIGPRPIVDAEAVKYKDDFKSYSAVRPGISGLWQVSGRSDVDFDTRVQMDKEYVDTWSFWTDVKIMFLTIPALLGQSGAR